MLTMRVPTESWLTGDWVVLGTYVPHWAIVIAGLILVALLVAWFERPSRSLVRFSPRATADYDASALPERPVSSPR
jgi:hypothetical protein